MGKWPNFGSLVKCPLLGGAGNSTPATSVLQARPKRAPHNQGCTFRNEVRTRKLRSYNGAHSKERPPGQQSHAVLAPAPLARQATRETRALRSRGTHEAARIAQVEMQVVT